MSVTDPTARARQPRLFDVGAAPPMPAGKRQPVDARDPGPRSSRPSSRRPVVAAVETSTARATATTAAQLARELAAPLTFVFVRRRPRPLVGAARVGRQLDRELQRGRHALDLALAAASDAGVMAHGEMIEGDPDRAILEYARARAARLLVVGSRRRRFGPSVSRRVLHQARLPVVVAAAGEAAVAHADVDAATTRAPAQRRAATAGSAPVRLFGRRRREMGAPPERRPA